MTAELDRIKALAGLISAEDDDDIFFSVSVKQKQQVIVEKLSKNAPIKDNHHHHGVTLSSSLQHQHHHQPHQQQMVIDSHSHNNNSQVVQFGESTDQQTFISASVRERAAAMSGFLTKKKDGPTSGQARAMEWRGGETTTTKKKMIVTTASSSVVSKQQLDHRLGENNVNGGGGGGTTSLTTSKAYHGHNITNTTNNNNTKSKPSFLLHFEDNNYNNSPKAATTTTTTTIGLQSPRVPLTPRTPTTRAPLTPRTPLTSSLRIMNNSNSLLSPRTATTTTATTATTPRSNQSSRNRSSNNSWVLRSPRGGGMLNSRNTTTTTTNNNNNNNTAPAHLNYSTTAEAGSSSSITDEIDDWLGGLSLSDSEEGGRGGGHDEDEDDNDKMSNCNDDNGDVVDDDEFFMNDVDKVLLEANGFGGGRRGHDDDDDDNELLSNCNDGDDNEFFINDLDKVLLEANGFLVGVVASSSSSSSSDDDDASDNDEEETRHFRFNEEEEEVEENVGMSDDLESELESARQLAQDFTRFLVHDEGSTSSGGGGGSGSSSREVVEIIEEVMDCGWADVEKEGGNEYVESPIEDDAAAAAAEEEEDDNDDDEYNVDETEGDWDGWNSNNNDDFFAHFDREAPAEDASQTAASEPVALQGEAVPSQVQLDMSRSEMKCSKPKLKIQIKGAPKFVPNKEEDGDKGLFYYVSQPSPLARDDEQLLDTQLVMPSPGAVESESSKTNTSPKKFDLKKIVHRVCPESDGERVSKTDSSPKKFGLKKIVHQTRPESDEESVVESSSYEEDVSPFHSNFHMSVSLTKSDETEKKGAKTPPKLTIYIKGAPQFTPSRPFEEDAFYVSNPSPLVGDDKGLLSSDFAWSPSVFDQKKESTLTSSTKKHFKNFVSKTLPAPKYQAALKVVAMSGQSTAMNTASDEPETQCFGDDFFYPAPESPVRQARDVMKDGGSTKKKILGLLSGKKKRQKKGLYLLDD